MFCGSQNHSSLRTTCLQNLSPNITTIRNKSPFLVFLSLQAPRSCRHSLNSPSTLLTFDMSLLLSGFHSALPELSFLLSLLATIASWYQLLLWLPLCPSDILLIAMPPFLVPTPALSSRPSGHQSWGALPAWRVSMCILTFPNILAVHHVSCHFLSLSPTKSPYHLELNLLANPVIISTYILNPISSIYYHSIYLKLKKHHDFLRYRLHYRYSLIKGLQV